MDLRRSAALAPVEEARRQELPPYVIFHDSTLIEVARRRPASLEVLAHVPGIGRSKLERYGKAVIGIVSESVTQRGACGPAQHQTETGSGRPMSERSSAEEGTPG